MHVSRQPSIPAPATFFPGQGRPFASPRGPVEISKIEITPRMKAACAPRFPLGREMHNDPIFQDFV